MLIMCISIKELIETFDHGLIAIGTKDSGIYFKAPWMMKVDTGGNVIFANRADYIPFPYGGHFPCIIQLSDSSLMAGTYIQSGIYYKAALCHFQSNGALLSSRQWDLSYHNNSFADNLLRTINGGYALMMWFNPSGQLNEMLLTIFDSTGYTNCGTFPISIPWQQDTIVTSTVSYSSQLLALNESLRTLSYYNIYGQSERCNQFSKASEIDFPGSISIVPNPAHNSAVISVSGICSEASFLVITDLSGRQIRKWKITQPNVHIELIDFVRGMYFLSLMDGQQITVRDKLIIE